MTAKYRHEIYTSSNTVAGYLLLAISNSSHHSYNIGDDEEMHAITLDRNYGNEDLIGILNRMGVDYDDVISTKLI